MNRLAVSSLRGLACLMLVLYHVVGGTPEQGLRLADGALRGVSDTLAAVRMPLFALLAGALHANSRHSGWPLLHDKFLRLILPMLTVGTAFAVVQAFTPGTNENTTDWSTLHLLPVAHFWFLEALFLIFVVWTFISTWSWVRQPWVQVALAAVALTAYLSAWGSAWLALAGAVYLLPFFGVGYLLVRHRVALRRESAIAAGEAKGLLARWAGFGLVLAASLSLAVASTGAAADRMTLPMLVAGLLSASALWLMPVKHPLLAWVGERSYAIFLFHVFFTAAVRLALGKLGWPASGLAGDAGAAVLSFPLFLHVLLGMTAGVLGPALLQRVLQRHPRLALCLLGQVPARPADVREPLAAQVVGKAV